MSKETARKLIELAKAATPGPWVNRPHGVIQSQSVEHIVLWDDTARAKDKGLENYTLIAACSPDVIQALMTRYLKMEAALEKIESDFIPVTSREFSLAIGEMRDCAREALKEVE